MDDYVVDGIMKGPAFRALGEYLGVCLLFSCTIITVCVLSSGGTRLALAKGETDVQVGRRQHAAAFIRGCVVTLVVFRGQASCGSVRQKFKPIKLRRD